MHGVEFLQDMAVVMMVAGLVTILFHRFRQPVVLGYVAAGVIVGPHTPPYTLIHDEATIRTLAEMGIVFLMFGLGLEFNLRKLKKVGSTALIAAPLEITLMLGLGYQLGRWFGWELMDCLFLGAMMSISSTTIIVKALRELGLTKERSSGLIFGILIVEDVLAIVMIALLSGIAMTGSLSLQDVGVTVGRLSIFLATALVAGLIGVPRLMAYVGRFRSDEMLLVTALGLLFGFSILAVKLGYSAALGAFVVGAMVAESREAGRIEHLAAPIRDMFSAVFFVTVGMLIDPRLLWQHAGPILAISAAVMLGKLTACSFGTFVAGEGGRSSLRVGSGMAQIGEFSFIIAALGVQLKVTSDFLYPIAVAVSVITTLFTPYLIRSAGPLAALVESKGPEPLVRLLEAYTQWVGRLSRREGPGVASRMIRRWTVQMVLNLLLAAGVFLAAAFLSRQTPSWLPTVLREGAAHGVFLWLLAVVATLPLFIATFRKLQALGLLVAELKVTRAAAGERTAALRSMVANAIPLAGLAGMVVFGLALSSPVLPTQGVLPVLVATVAFLTALLWKSAIRIYSKAQFALEETFRNPAPVEEPAPRPIPALLRDADLQTVTLTEGAPAVRRLIRELALRTHSGASVVGIERRGVPIINPGPDEELQSGDVVLLLGSANQIDSARKVLVGAASD
jgi:CPA2 family monovalent cation:H+ antiporter-2